MTLTIKLLSPSGAAEISGLDCSKRFNPEVAAQVRKAFLDHPVLVFRNQQLTAQQLAAFAGQFGRLEDFGDLPPLPGPTEQIERPETPLLPELSGPPAPNCYIYFHPDDNRVQFMINEARHDLPLMGMLDNAQTWHADTQYRLNPNKATILNNVVRPSSGGETEFSDMALLYESLTDELQSLLNDCVGIHQWSKSKNFMFANMLDDDARAEGDRIAALVPSMRHPLVRRHPDTGRPILFASPRFTIGIEGWGEAKSESLLRAIFQAIDDPRFTYLHRWRDHDLVMWDNCRLVHRAYGYSHAEIRHINRIALCEERPVVGLSHPLAD